MKRTKLGEANHLVKQIEECKNRIEQYENSRQFECLEIGNAYDYTESERHRHRIILYIKGKNGAENEAYQLFLDTLLTIEDKKLAELEKKFEEL